MRHRGLCFLLVFARLFAAFGTLGASSLASAEDDFAYGRATLRELVEINTTDSSGDNTAAANAMAARLRAAGFAAEDIRVEGPAPRKGNLVLRWKGIDNQRKPVLFIAHLDVVEARREDWTTDPFQFVEKEGFYYGRGVLDNKLGASILVSTFARLKREGYKPHRTLILALTADEEGGDHNGVAWLLAKHRDWIDAEFAVNSDSGEGYLRDGKPQFMGFQASEKTFCSFALEVNNRGGHSSLPRPDNAIYKLSAALLKIQQHQFPVRLNEVTRAWLLRRAPFEPGQTGKDYQAVAESGDAAAADRLSASSPNLNALMRTTCVATLLSGGHAENALPQTAKATVNCRLLPGDTPAETEKALKAVVNDPEVKITPLRPTTVSPASPLRADLLSKVETITGELWPGVVTVPVMETGATDGRPLRVAGIPTYGIGGYFFDPTDIRAHGKDERIRIDSLKEGLSFYYLLVRALGR